MSNTVYDILSIESIRFDSKNEHIVVRAILDNIAYIRGSQTYWDPPEYAPFLCETTIYTDNLPDSVLLQDDDEYLEEVINQYNLLANQDWEPVHEDYSYSDDD